MAPANKKTTTKKKANPWFKAVGEAHKKMKKKYPEEFKGFVAIRKTTKTDKKLTQKEKRLYELGHMWYLEAVKIKGC